MLSGGWARIERRACGEYFNVSSQKVVAGPQPKPPALNIVVPARGRYSAAARLPFPVASIDSRLQPRIPVAFGMHRLTY